MSMLTNLYTDNVEWIWFIAKWFLLALVTGAFGYFIKPELINEISALFEEKFGVMPEANSNLAWEIFRQNLIACLLALVGGVVFGLSAVLIVFFNGFIIGFVVTLLLTLPGNPSQNILYLILGLVPHGVFEIPAFIFASALGLRLGTEWLKKDNTGKRFEIFKANVIRVLYSLPILVILLLIAAFVEVFVSGKLVGNFQ